MALNNLLLFSFLTIFTSCNGQVKTNPVKVPITSEPGPTVIKNFKAVALAPDFDTTLVSQYIRSIFQDSKGNLWFGTLGEGVVRYDVKTLTYFSNPDGFKNNTVYAINEDKNGNIWLGTDQGVYKYDPSAYFDSAQHKSLRAGGKNFRNYNQKDGLSHVDITRKGILVDRMGTIWVGTHGGVFTYDPIADSKGEQSFSLFQELPPINVAGIMEDQSGNIWFASSNNGVFRYNPSASLTAGGKTLTEYTSKDGLGGTEIWGIYIEEPSGIIWVTARGSTTRFDPSVPLPNPQAFTVFTPANGLNCCVQSMYQDKSGNMWWGAGQGLYRFDGQRFYQVKKRGPW